MKEFYSIQSEYNGLVAKKYRLQSKSKRQAQMKADHEKGNKGNAVRETTKNLEHFQTSVFKNIKREESLSPLTLKLVSIVLRVKL